MIVAHKRLYRCGEFCSAIYSEAKKQAAIRLIAVESFTLLTLLLLTFWSVQPLLEEWAMFRAFNVYGQGYLLQLARTLPMRPLHLSYAGF